jgi:hypothetical protein
VKDIQCCDTGLAHSMLTIAEAEQLPENHELRVRALDFDTAMRAYYLGKCSKRRFMGIWARARRAYIAFTEEASRA